jgi:hypothetical protein
VASNPTTRPEPPGTFLAWTVGGLPDGFAERAAQLPDVRQVVSVRSDTAWLTGSATPDGEIVDDPPNGYSIPLEVTAVEPRDYTPFLPPADRGVVVALAAGQGILGESSAKLRNLGPGSTLSFGSTSIRVGAVLPDELVGASELMVSRRTGLEIGVVRERYMLFQPTPPPTAERELPRYDRRFERQLGNLSAGAPVRVRAPGETPYFRQGDAVLPPVQLKLLFGEFAARPGPGGTLQLDPAWVRRNIATRRVPLLGEVTCNVRLFPQLIGAMREVVASGLSETVRTYHGCWVPKRILNVPSAQVSHHTWGVAFDINIVGNAYGATPHQNPRLVRILEKWGFIWGGTFMVPDGNHFEYRRPPPEG